MDLALTLLVFLPEDKPQGFVLGKQLFRREAVDDIQAGQDHGLGVCRHQH